MVGELTRLVCARVSLSRCVMQEKLTEGLATRQVITDHCTGGGSAYAAIDNKYERLTSQLSSFINVDLYVSLYSIAIQQSQQLSMPNPQNSQHAEIPSLPDEYSKTSIPP